MTRTMNEMDGDTRHDYDKYIMEVMQMEWEQQQVLRTASEQGSANASQVAAGDTVVSSVRPVKGRPMWDGQECAVLCWRCDEQAEYAGYCEVHYADHLQELAEDDLQAHDEWVEEAYGAEELERAMREVEEDRNDH